MNSPVKNKYVIFLSIAIPRQQHKDFINVILKVLDQITLENNF